MQGKVWNAVLATLVFTAIPTAVLGQSQFTGVVRDESGGALPGVTVEASSPVLIEKTRAVVSDSTGRYTIVDLRPGTYKLTFTLTGFATAIRDQVERVQQALAREPRLALRLVRGPLHVVRIGRRGRALDGR